MSRCRFANEMKIYRADSELSMVSGWEIDELTILGAIGGDIIGSCYELKNTRIKTTNFELFSPQSTWTDDSILTIAIAKWLSECYYIPDDTSRLIDITKDIGLRYIDVGYGNKFKDWLLSDSTTPYNSCGNGSAMRVAPVGLFCQELKQCLFLSKLSASITHNHPEGVKGAQAIACAIFLSKYGVCKKYIKNYIERKFGYNLDRSINDIRPSYVFDPTCQGSVPEAIICFLESTNYESAVRLAVSLGGDSDTIACMAGAIAACYYRELPKSVIDKIASIVPQEFLDILRSFLCQNNDIAKTICFDESIVTKEIKEYVII